MFVPLWQPASAFLYACAYCVFEANKYDDDDDDDFVATMGGLLLRERRGGERGD